MHSLVFCTLLIFLGSHCIRKKCFFQKQLDNQFSVQLCWSIDFHFFVPLCLLMIRKKDVNSGEPINFLLHKLWPTCSMIEWKVCWYLVNIFQSMKLYMSCVTKLVSNSATLINRPSVDYLTSHSTMPGFHLLTSHNVLWKACRWYWAILSQCSVRLCEVSGWIKTCKFHERWKNIHGQAVHIHFHIKLAIGTKHHISRCAFFQSCWLARWTQRCKESRWIWKQHALEAKRG